MNKLIYFLAALVLLLAAQTVQAQLPRLDSIPHTGKASQLWFALDSLPQDSQNLLSIRQDYDWTGGVAIQPENWGSALPQFRILAELEGISFRDAATSLWAEVEWQHSRAWLCGDSLLCIEFDAKGDVGLTYFLKFRLQPTGHVTGGWAKISTKESYTEADQAKVLWQQAGNTFYLWWPQGLPEIWQGYSPVLSGYPVDLGWTELTDSTPAIRIRLAGQH